MNDVLQVEEGLAGWKRGLELVVLESWTLTGSLGLMVTGALLRPHDGKKERKERQHRLLRSFWSKNLWSQSLKREGQKGSTPTAKIGHLSLTQHVTLFSHGS